MQSGRETTGLPMLTWVSQCLGTCVNCEWDEGCSSGQTSSLIPRCKSGEDFVDLEIGFAAKCLVSAATCTLCWAPE